MRKITKKRRTNFSRNLRELQRTRKYLEEIKCFITRDIPVYWKFDREGNIMMATTNALVAREKGCTRAFFS